MPTGIYDRSKSNYKPHWTGKTFSVEHRRKLSLAGMGRKTAPRSLSARLKQSNTMKLRGIKPPNRKGAKLTAEQLLKWSEVKKGSRTHLWRGGISKQNRTERENFMSTFAYKDWRRQVFSRDKFCCVNCGENGYLQADHIKPYALFPELRLKLSNGRTLCRKCHGLIGWRPGREKQWEAAVKLL